MGWDMSANLKTEVVAQMLVEKLGETKAREIFPLNLNPDDEGHPVDRSVNASASFIMDLLADAKIMDFLKDGTLEIGSNNWVAGPAMSSSGKPVVSDDPHMRTGMLPGPLYPVGMITPNFRVVGVAVPGVAGLPIFRSDHIAVGLTNAYADVQDLYVETIDPDFPDHYHEGNASIAFSIIEEMIKIKDKKAEEGFIYETVKIRLTKRGPVVSDVIKGLESDKVLSIRWSPYETMSPTIGFTPLLTATSVESAVAAIGKINVVSLNFVFADTAGNIGWQVSGRLPIRSRGDGTVPFEVTDNRDNWRGFVPFEQMPHAINPDKGWLGTCNHHTVPHDYPYYYSSYQSPTYRYRRLKQLMNTPGEKTVDDHWSYQRDTFNLMAEKLVPYMVDVLEDSAQTRELGRILNGWDLHDDIDAVGATLFHSIYERFAWLTFSDELGEDLAKKMLGVWYFWQERFQQMVLTDHLGHWFDDTTTAEIVEGKSEILIRAALDAKTRLSASLGSNPDRWQWGNVHQHTFVSPIRRDGLGKGFLGGGTHPAAGSVEVLYRGLYEYNDPYSVTVSAALRMVADLADEDKVLAVLPGGVAGRIFHPHATDQIGAFMDGEKMYWWFSEREIANHTSAVLMLTPETAPPSN
jgi:penicillin amidase